MTDIAKTNPASPGPRCCRSIAGTNGKGYGSELHRLLQSAGYLFMGYYNRGPHSAQRGINLSYAAYGVKQVAVPTAVPMQKRQPVTAMLRHSYYTIGCQGV